MDGSVTLRPAIVAAIGLVAISAAHADPWLPPGDLAVRHDVELLADVGVLKGPTTTWPLSWGDIANGLAEANVATLGVAERAALLRLQQRVKEEKRTDGISPEFRMAIAGDEPRRLRTFEATPREKGELQTGVAWTGLRMSYRIQGTVVSDPKDDQNLRVDGSYVGGAAGNWMFAASAMDRWWGPGWGSSLILSSNARPIPALTVNRNLSEPPHARWLHWVGPWSATIMMGQLEHDRDVPDALFFGARFAFRPVPSLEIAVSRTAQWCGEDRPCDLGTFWDLLVGNDTRTVTTTLEDEPGNQLAGADLRWTGGPHGRRYAVYGQLIGEDVTSGTSPAKFTGRFGFERWGYFEQWHASYRWSLEGANTAANFLGEPKYNYSYEHFIYFDGYRYRGRAIGDSLDNDGRIGALQGMLISEHDRTWTALLQFAQINRDDTEKAPGTQTVSATAADLWNFEVGHGRPLGRGTLSLGLGFERFEHKDSGDTEDSPRFMLQWESTQ